MASRYSYISEALSIDFSPNAYFSSDFKSAFFSEISFYAY